MHHLNHPPVVRDAGGRFAAGTCGRLFGSRNRLSKRVARALLRDFEANQAELLPRLRQWFLPEYLRLIGRLLPRQQEAGGPELDDLDEAESPADRRDAGGAEPDRGRRRRPDRPGGGAAGRGSGGRRRRRGRRYYR
jgi:hypothetical protein